MKQKKLMRCKVIDRENGLNLERKKFKKRKILNVKEEKYKEKKEKVRYQ